MLCVGYYFLEREGEAMKQSSSLLHYVDLYANMIYAHGPSRPINSQARNQSVVWEV